ncbi:hypothetical protein [Bordetella genomosp. 5]|uniref:hypothetical protein n=1 Tax=Bordetella genomosp. 5 TaxID=1395608 RepID=UPI001140484B|nr:hypothetical protein [Bordetella genomosp. 5]
MVESVVDVSRSTLGLVTPGANAASAPLSQAWHYVSVIYGVVAVAVLLAVLAIRYVWARGTMDGEQRVGLGRLCATTALSTSLGACVLLSLHGVEPVITLEAGAAGGANRERGAAVLAPFIATMMCVVLWAKATFAQRGMLLIYGGIGALGSLLAGPGPLWTIFLALVLGALSVPCVSWILSKAERVAKP